MRKLSVVIITYNEEANIRDCIASVKELADEVIVLDSFSTDQTVTYAVASGAKVFQHAFDGHIEQKNRAIGYANHELVLSLDADERLSDELRASISKAKLEDLDGYFMNRLNFYKGRAIKSCGWYPDRKLRLWLAAKGRWGGTNPHDRFEMQENSRIAFLKGDLLHYTYPTKKSLQKQVDKFAAISSKQLQVKSKLYLLFKLLFSPSFKFIKTYFIQLGFTDGSDGLYICWMQAKEVFLKYAMALRLISSASR